MTSTTLTNARATLPQLIKKVDEHYERIVITVHGEEKAVIISPEEIESYEETISTLSDSDAMAALVEADKDWKKGETYTHDDVFGTRAA